jgi:hypothetical protein
LTNSYGCREGWAKMPKTNPAEAEFTGLMLQIRQIGRSWGLSSAKPD